MHYANQRMRVWLSIMLAAMPFLLMGSASTINAIIMYLGSPFTFMGNFSWVVPLTVGLLTPGLCLFTIGVYKARIYYMRVVFEAIRYPYRDTSEILALAATLTYGFQITQLFWEFIGALTIVSIIFIVGSFVMLLVGYGEGGQWAHARGVVMYLSIQTLVSGFVLLLAFLRIPDHLALWTPIPVVIVMVSSLIPGGIVPLIVSALKKPVQPAESYGEVARKRLEGLDGHGSREHEEPRLAFQFCPFCRRPVDRDGLRFCAGCGKELF